MWESSSTSASGPWRRARARSSASVIEWSPPSTSGEDARLDERGEPLLDPPVGALGVARRDREVAVVDDGDGFHHVDAVSGVVGTEQGRRRPDAFGAEARP